MPKRCNVAGELNRAVASRGGEHFDGLGKAGDRRREDVEVLTREIVERAREQVPDRGRLPLGEDIEHRRLIPRKCTA